MINFKQMKKLTSKTVKKDGYILTVGQGYTYNLDKDKDGKKLPVVKVIAKPITEVIIGDDDHTYLSYNNSKGCLNPVSLVNVVTFVKYNDKNEIEFQRTRTDLDGTFTNKTAAELQQLIKALICFNK